ncbi:MAG: Maf family protein [Leptospirales bacterium]|nr:Maf family protein [Leptospirales bacterium]
MNIILGSGSLRRKNILEEIFDRLQIIIPSTDEMKFKDEIPYGYVERITNSKMDSILKLTKKSDDFFAITSDTIVSIDEKILGKPLSRDEAFSMLKLLSGREHSVITGICIILKNSVEIKRLYAYEKTCVKFKELSDKSIDFYLSCADYKDKAGSYAIQEYGEQIIDKVHGSVTNVIGFPLTLFFRMINQIGAQDILCENIN